MNISSLPVLHTKFSRIARWFLGLTVLESLGIIAVLLREPSDADVARFLGYSALRWTMVLSVLVLVVSSAAFYLFVGRQIDRLESDFSRRWSGRLFALKISGLAVFWVCFRSILFVESLGDPTVSRIYWQAFPLVALLGVMALQSSLFLYLLFPPASARVRLPMLARAGVLWAVLAAFGLVVYLSGFGLEKIWNGWRAYGIPLAHIQVLDLVSLAWLATAVLRNQKTLSRVPTAVLDSGLCLLIWLAAVFTWLPMPVPNTYMSTMPFPPNQAVYPSSDAMLYDSFAEGLLLREPWVHEAAPNKPLYVVFLTLAHLVAGHNYVPVIVIQTLLLAILPVLLFLLGRLSFNRLAGVMIAALVILREYNQIFTGSLVTSSNSKLMLSELPTGLGLCILLLTAAWWMRLPRQRPWMAVLAGGLTGLTAQIRMQMIAFLPFLAVLAALYFWRQRKSLSTGTTWWKRAVYTALFLSLGFAASLAPLLARNYQTIGEPVIEAQRYMGATLTAAFAPTSSQTVSRTGLVARGFVRNLVQPLLVLPSGFQAEDGWTNTLDLRSGFWVTTNTHLSPIQAGWVLANLALISIGVIAGWRSSGWVSLLPALGFVAYSLTNAAGGYSGGRFSLPVDWVSGFYFMIGFAYLLGGSSSLAGPHSFPEIDGAAQHSKAQLSKTVVVTAVLLVVGGLLPLLEAVLPARPEGSSEENRTTLVELAGKALSPAEITQLQALLARPDTVIFHGSALYPREIQQETAPGAFLTTDPEVGAPFLSYIYLGTTRAIVLQPWDGTSRDFPHTAEVLLAGWQAGRHFHAFITVQPSSGTVYFSPSLKAQGE